VKFPLTLIQDYSSPAIDMIRAAIDTFQADPADTDFQRGYQAALQDMLREVFEAEHEAQS
jgi:hypothetical protein